MKRLDVKTLLERVASASVKTKVIAGVVATTVVVGTVGGVVYFNRDTKEEPVDEVVVAEVEDPAKEEIEFTDVELEMYAKEDGEVIDNPTDKNTVATFEKDDLLNVTGEADAWYRVDVFGRVGIVRKNTLTADAPVVEEETKETASSSTSSKKSSSAKSDTKKNTSNSGNSSTTSNGSASASSRTPSTSSSNATTGNVDTAAPTTDPGVESGATPTTPPVVEPQPSSEPTPAPSIDANGWDTSSASYQAWAADMERVRAIEEETRQQEQSAAENEARARAEHPELFQ